MRTGQYRPRFCRDLLGAADRRGSETRDIPVGKRTGAASTMDFRPWRPMMMVRSWS